MDNMLDQWLCKRFASSPGCAAGLRENINTHGEFVEKNRLCSSKMSYHHKTGINHVTAGLFLGFQTGIQLLGLFWLPGVVIKKKLFENK